MKELQMQKCKLLAVSWRIQMGSVRFFFFSKHGEIQLDQVGGAINFWSHTSPTNETLITQSQPAGEESL